MGAVVWLPPIVSFSIIVGIGLRPYLELLRRECECGGKRLNAKKKERKDGS